MASNTLSFPTTQQLSAFGLADILGNSNNPIDFTSTSNEHPDLTSALVTPHIDLGLLPHSQLPIVSGDNGTLVPLSGSDNPAYMRLACIYQHRKRQFQQLTRCHDPDASGHETCTTTVCYRIVSLLSVPFVPPLSLLPHSGLIYDNTLLDLFQLCLVVSRFVVPALWSP